MGDCQRSCCGSYEVEFTPATLWLTEDPITDNIQRHGTGEGFAVSCEIRCSLDEFICENLNSLSRAWHNLLGAQVLVYKMASNRVNYFTTGNKEATNTLMQYFDKVYRQSLKSAIDSIPLDDMWLRM